MQVAYRKHRVERKRIGDVSPDRVGDQIHDAEDREGKRGLHHDRHGPCVDLRVCPVMASHASTNIDDAATDETSDEDIECRC